MCFPPEESNDPTTEGKLAVGCGEGTDEVSPERLKGLFCCVDPMVVGFDEEIVALFEGEIFHDNLTCLVIHHIQFNLVSFQF